MNLASARENRPRFLALACVVASLIAASCAGLAEPLPPSGLWVARLGAADVSTATEAAFVMCGGAATSYEALDWMAEKAGGGDFVELCLNPAESPWNKLHKRGIFNSVTSIAVSDRELADSDYVNKVLRDAEAVYIAGGDQGEYYLAWNGTKLEDTLEWLATVKKVPIGGTSAGMASLGRWVYTAELGVADSEGSLANPYGEDVTIRDDFLDFPLGAGLVTDTHWSERDRLGRTVVFLARIIADGMAAPGGVYAIACDEGAALCLDSAGRATVFGSLDEYDDYVFVLVPRRAPDRCEPGKPLEWRDGLVAYRIPGWPDGRAKFELATLRAFGPAPEGLERFALDVVGGTVSPDIQKPDIDEDEED